MLQWAYESPHGEATLYSDMMIVALNTAKMEPSGQASSLLPVSLY